MTLDISKYLENLIKKEAKISHFAVAISAGKTSLIKPEFSNTIRKDNGDTYLQDANYLVFFSKSDAWSSDDKVKIFDLVNRALGKDANNMAKSDFKELGQVSSTDVVDDDSDDEETEVQDTSSHNTSSHTLFIKVTIK